MQTVHNSPVAVEGKFGPRELAFRVNRLVGTVVTVGYYASLPPSISYMIYTRFLFT